MIDLFQRPPTCHPKKSKSGCFIRSTVDPNLDVTIVGYYARYIASPHLFGSINSPRKNSSQRVIVKQGPDFLCGEIG
jgi:hypothetical protein